jgi:hypothetical protein
VDRRLDLSEVEQTLLEIGAELNEELIPNSKPEVRVTSMDLRHVKLALLLRVNNPAKGKILASDVRKKAKKKLDEIQGKAAF